MRTVRIDLSPERISAVVVETGATWSAPASVAVTLNDKGEMLGVAVGEYEHDAEIEHAKAVFDPEGKEIRRVLPFPAAWPRSATPLVSVEALAPKHSDAAVPELGPKDMMLCWVLRPNTINLLLIDAMVRWAVVMVLQDRSLWPLSWRARVEIHWPDFDRLPPHVHDAFVRLLWDSYGRRVVVNGRPTAVTRRRTLRDLPPAARKQLMVSGGAAVVGLGVLCWRASAQQAGVYAALLVAWAAFSWVSWLRS